jgi:hypothetical protein
MMRRPVLRAFRKLYDQACADLAEMNRRHQSAIADLTHELEEVRAEFEELKAAVRRRVAAEQEVVALRRERELMLALRAERDPALPLQ